MQCLECILDRHLDSIIELVSTGCENLDSVVRHGLCDAEIMTPRLASSFAVKYATAGVGRIPTSSTSTPAELNPAVTAA